MDWFTLRALAASWNDALAGGTLDDAWTQTANELSLGVTDRHGSPSVLRIVCDPALTVAFRSPGGGRQKRNTADVFAGAVGRQLEAVRVADRDRHLFLELADGSRLQMLLFGSRPTVLQVADGTVREAFVHASAWEGEPAPQPRAAPDPTTPEAVREGWPDSAKKLAVAVRRTAPLLPPPLVAAILRQLALDPSAPPPPECPLELANGLVDLRRQLEAERSPVILWRNEMAEAVLPIPPVHLDDGWTAEPFNDIDKAVRVYARRALGQRQFQTLYRPVESALAAATDRRTRSAEAMLAELATPSRADRYEHWGHLLMAQATDKGPGHESLLLPNILSETGGTVEIPMDPALSAIENAQRFYDKARRTRRARETAEARWESVQAEADAMADLLDRLRQLETVPDLRAFLDAEADALARWTGGRSRETAEPFRRIALVEGWEALVGRNARSNAHLTTRVARPHDLWLHARGVSGSHVLIRRATRATEVPRVAIELAARIAAHYSDARTQTLAPVIVTERKYVRPIKGGPPGLVRVDRETVLDVEPGLPGAS
ncbi:MAG: NFACT RNA binding domain-containing protein [Bacteroidota bacterium]